MEMEGRGGERREGEGRCRRGGEMQKGREGRGEAEGRGGEGKGEGNVLTGCTHTTARPFGVCTTHCPLTPWTRLMVNE